MHIRVLATFVFALALPAIAGAQTWTSPDGFLSITPPDANEFQAMPIPPPPFVGLWISNDETMKFGLMQTQIPPNIKLMQSSVEEGLENETGGTVTRFPTKKVAGHEVWTMTAKNESVEITQAILRHDNTVYKLMAVTVGDKPDSAAVNRFLDSLSIMQPAPSMKEQPAPQTVQDLSVGMDLHNLSKKIGGASLLLGIGLVAYFLMRGKKNSQT